LLLIINAAVYFVSIQSRPLQSNRTSPLDELSPEKIVLLPNDENCFEWGSFHEDQIKYAEAVIAEIISEHYYEVEEAGTTMMYWLYVPPLANKEAASRTINKLRNIGIVSFRIKDNDQWRNAISIDMFADEQAAIEQLKEIEKKGVTGLMIENRSVLLKKIIIYNPAQQTKAQLQNLTEQIEGTHLVQTQCERL